MRYIKRVAMLSTMCIGLAYCIPSIYAKDKMSYIKELTEYGFGAKNVVYATTSGDPLFVPEFRLYQETRNSKVYLLISVNDTDVSVSINGSSVDIFRDDIYRFGYQVTKAGKYEVKVTGRNNVTRTDSININMLDSSTTLDLSKEYKDGACYLIIKAKDGDGIKNVSVNDVSVPFNDYSGETSYRIYNTGTYTVKVTDKNDNRKSESIYINVNSSAPTVSLTKTYRNSKWYLVIKANADSSISQVTVNGSKISFPSSGGTVEYEIDKSNTYKVIVTDKEGYTITDSIYVDMDNKTSEKPTVKVSQNYKISGEIGWYLLIKAADDRGIASVKVNGNNVPFDTSSGMAQYYVPTDGTYNIEVTDTDGNTYTTSTYAAGNAGINSNAASNSSNTDNVKIVFKLNSRTWTKDGVAQEQMNIAPRTANSRVYLPLRYMAYALGINSGNISWDKSTKKVTIYDGSDVIKVTVGSKVMYVNDQVVKMNAVPIMKNGYVMLPISQIESAFKNRNIQLSWDNISKELIINR